LYIVGCGWLVAALAACSVEPQAAEAPLFPADAPSTWQQVRDCRHSHEHELNHIRVLADPAAVGPYLGWNAPFPVGATLLKLEYDDDACSHLIRYTVMQKRAAGSDVERGDWRWQTVSPAREVLPSATATCVGCHRVHCSEADGTGFDLTCAEEL
jgi:hypothetical protein